MDEMKTVDTAATEESFEALLDASIKTLTTGDTVTGTVVAIGTTEVQVDLGTKHAGYIPCDEVSADPNVKPEDVLHVGDEIKVFVVRVNDQEGTVQLSRKKLDGMRVWEELQELADNKTPVEAKITEVNKGGLVANVKGVRVFIPASASGVARGGNLEELKGETVKIRITEVNRERRGGRVVGSIRAVANEERRAAQEKIWSEIEVGKKYTGTVKSLTSYGAFVDIGGVEGLVPNAEISWDRSVKPSDVLSEGDTVSVKIRRIDWENDRFTFSLKDLSADPWQDYAAGLSEGDRVTGKVAKIMPFGAFVQLVPGVDGLLPISRLGNGRHIVDASEVVKVGDELELRIESVDPVARKISLSLVDKRVDALKPGEIAVGAQLKGIVESVRDFGVFVRLSETKTGLLHASETGIERGGIQRAKMEAKFPEGSDVDVVVKGVDGDRISLTLPSVLEAEAAAERERAEVKAALRENKAASAASGLGSFGSLLDAALGGGQ